MTTKEKIIEQNDKVNIISASAEINGEVLQLITRNVETGNTYYVLLKKANGDEHRYPAVDYELLDDAVDLFEFFTLFE